MSRFFLFSLISIGCIWGILYGVDQLKNIKIQHKKRAALAIGGGIISAFIWFLMEVNL